PEISTLSLHDALPISTQRFGFTRRLEGRLERAVAPEACPDPRSDRIAVLAGHRMDPEDIGPFKGCLDLRRPEGFAVPDEVVAGPDRKSTRLNSSHLVI